MFTNFNWKWKINKKFWINILWLLMHPSQPSTMISEQVRTFNWKCAEIHFIQKLINVHAIHVQKVHLKHWFVFRSIYDKYISELIFTIKILNSDTIGWITQQKDNYCNIKQFEGNAPSQVNRTHGYWIFIILTRE